jgi:hypothetical protein
MYISGSFFKNFERSSFEFLDRDFNVFAKFEERRERRLALEQLGFADFYEKGEIILSVIWAININGQMRVFRALIIPVCLEIGVNKDTVAQSLLADIQAKLNEGAVVLPVPKLVQGPKGFIFSALVGFQVDQEIPYFFDRMAAAPSCCVLLQLLQGIPERELGVVEVRIPERLSRGIDSVVKTRSQQVHHIEGNDSDGVRDGYAELDYEKFASSFTVNLDQTSVWITVGEDIELKFEFCEVFARPSAKGVRAIKCRSNDSELI